MALKEENGPNEANNRPILILFFFKMMEIFQGF